MTDASRPTADASDRVARGVFLITLGFVVAFVGAVIIYVL